MTDLIKELEAVALLAEKATPGDWVWRRDAGKPMLINGLMFGGAGPDGQPNDAAFIIALVNLFRTHHAEIAEAVKDARRWRVARNNTGDGLRLIRWDRSQPEELQVMFPSPALCDSDADAAMHNSAREAGE